MASEATAPGFDAARAQVSDPPGFGPAGGQTSDPTSTLDGAAARTRLQLWMARLAGALQMVRRLIQLRPQLLQSRLLLLLTPGRAGIPASLAI